MMGLHDHALKKSSFVEIVAAECLGDIVIVAMCGRWSHANEQVHTGFVASGSCAVGLLVLWLLSSAARFYAPRSRPGSLERRRANPPALVLSIGLWRL